MKFYEITVAGGDEDSDDHTLWLAVLPLSGIGSTEVMANFARGLHTLVEKVKQIDLNETAVDITDPKVFDAVISKDIDLRPAVEAIAKKCRGVICKTDKGMGEIELREGYAEDGQIGHPVFTGRLWRSEVGQQNTIRGYWDWVAAKLEEESHGE